MIFLYTYLSYKTIRLTYNSLQNYDEMQFKKFRPKTI